MPESPPRQVHRLTGLDAQNPLAFLAALGTLRILDDVARVAGASAPRLRFVDTGSQVPEVETEHTADRLLEILVDDAASGRGGAALDLVYDDRGEAHVEATKRDLKPSPRLAAEYRLALAQRWHEDRRAADFAHAFFSELVQDNNGNTKPTALHFAAGQQQWLAMVLELRREASISRMREALFGPWTEHAAPSLAWDSTVARNYALRAVDPSSEKRGSIPGANWLGVVGLTFFPVEVVRHRVVTPRVVGGWKTSTFTWPLWSGWASSKVAQGILRADVAALDRGQRALLGVDRVHASRILRSEQGGYGSFSPSEVVG